MTGTSEPDRMRLGLAAMLALALAACSSTVVRTPQAETGTATTSTTGRSGASVVVQKGETLYSIARRNGVTVEDIARWNGLAPPYTIHPGQRLMLGQPGGKGGTTAPTRTVVAPKSGTTAPPLARRFSSSKGCRASTSSRLRSESIPGIEHLNC